MALSWFNKFGDALRGPSTGPIPPTGERASEKRPRSAVDSSLELGTASTKRSRYTMEDTFTLLVGETRTSFTVHTKLMCNTSDFLKAASKKEWREDQAKEVSMRDIEPFGFEAYSFWCYRRELDPQPTHDQPVPGNTIVVQLISVYITADFLRDTTAMAWALNELIDRNMAHRHSLFKQSPVHFRADQHPPFWGSAELITYLYENTPSSSLLRKFVAESMARSSSAEIRAVAAGVHEEFLTQLMFVLLPFRRPDRGSQEARARWPSKKIREEEYGERDRSSS